MARTRRLAKHVIGMSIAVFLGAARTIKRLFNVTPHDKLFAQNAHGGYHSLPDHRLAGTCNKALEGAAHVPVIVVEIDNPAGQHERPGPGIDKGAVRAAQPFFPFGIADLVANEQINGLRIGDAQEGFGHAHEDNALA